MKVLAIGAHPDDCESGAGATLAKHAAAGDEVRIYAMGGGAPWPPEHWRARRVWASGAAGLLGATFDCGPYPDQKYDEHPLSSLADWISNNVTREWWPDVVYCHHAGDLNQDHVAAAHAVKIAFRPKPGIKAPRIFAFEVLSSTELGEPFTPNVFVDVDGEPLEKKVMALEVYGDAIPPAPHPRSLEAVQALATLRGASVGLRAAEAFVLLREVL